MEDERANDLPEEMPEDRLIQQEPAEATASGMGRAVDAGVASSGPTMAGAGIHPLIHLIIDLGVGFCLLIVVGVFAAVVALVSHQFTARAALPLAVGLFFVVAMTRAVWSKLNPWIEGMAMSLGAVFPVALIAVALQGRILMVLAYGLMLAAICGAGAQTQRFVKARRWVSGTATVGGLVLVLVLGAKFLGPVFSSPWGRRAMNEPAPRFTVAMLDGSSVTLDSLKGRVVVMDFWGTWCGPCMAEMPTIQRVHRTFASNSNVVFLAVNAGWHGDSADVVRSFVGRRRLDVPVALDPDGATRQMKVDALPTLVLIDRQGRIRMEEAGFDANEPLESDLTGQIQGLLQP